MLHTLSVQNFTLIDTLDLELESGMTVISGETGAGKSIVLDALGLTLGNRADSRSLRVGADRLDVSASFDLRDCPDAMAWLAANELDEGHDCVLRRSVNADGRSKAWINGRPATLSDLRSLGDLLVDLHSQHEHHSLLSRQTQQTLLDEFGGHSELAAAARATYEQWRTTRAELDELRSRQQEKDDRQQLLIYQVEELDSLGLIAGEIESLEQEQTLLANAGGAITGLDRIISLLEDEEGGLLTVMRSARTQLEALRELGEQRRDGAELLESAQIQLEEARRELCTLRDRIDINPERLNVVEARLSAAFDQARKHRLQSRELPALHEQLRNELNELDQSDETLRAKEATLENLLAQWHGTAQQLSKKRKTAARQLEHDVEAQLALLGMENCTLHVELDSVEGPAAGGAEQVEFKVSTNPGVKPDALARVASGGELSRISLAIQVVTAGVRTTPTIIFDEVDVGIGGPTADAVGSLLQQLSRRCQVVCVTHLAQVASRAHHQLRAVKSSAADRTSAHLLLLSEEERIEEIARMLGTRKVTATTLDHAREMLEQARA